MYLSAMHVTFFFFKNNQQANGIDGVQQSENVQEVIKNSNQRLLNMAENDMKNNADRGGWYDEANDTLQQLLSYSLNY